MLASVEQQVRTCVTQLFEFITAQGDSDYIGERVSQLEHSLQAAHLAVEAGADSETVLGALLHDIGRFIPDADKMPAMIAPNGVFVGRGSHEVLGERYLRQLGFSDKICQLVGAHVMAKRYLTAVDREYYAGLSDSSKVTLKYQGGIFNDEQVKEAQKDPLLDAKLAVRRWDDQAKVPNMLTKPLKYYEPIAVKSLLDSSSLVELHGKKYHLPQRPTVVICIDGFDPEYLEKGIADGILPNMQSFVESGFSATAKCAMPSLTNPNNVSIITGVPTAVHGISTNFFLDRSTGKEYMITDDGLLRGSTILAQLSARGIRVAAITAKDKLRGFLKHGLMTSKDICFSAQCAQECTPVKNGISNVEEWIGRSSPEQYSSDLSIFVLDSGIKLIEEGRADFCYLTLSDFIQHKYGPGSKESDEFLSAVDERIGRFVDLGAVVAVTGDHGMSAKTNEDGSPNVLYLQEELDMKFGDGFSRVICPITDPFPGHHGALGSFVRVYLNQQTASLADVVDYCKLLPQVEIALEGSKAAELFEMPPDREGDIVVISKKNAVIGSRKSEHDLSNVRDHNLRSHGGLSEERVPLLRSLPLTGHQPNRQWRNFDAFEIALNY